MPLVKESVGTLSYDRDSPEVFKAVLLKLEAMNLPIESSDAQRGVIVVRCWSLAFNMILWRCWSDKILLEVRQEKEGKTTIEIWAVPNLFRFAVRPGERVCELATLLSSLRGLATT